MGRGTGESLYPSIQDFSSLPQGTYPHLAPTALFREPLVRTGFIRFYLGMFAMAVSHTNTFIQESPFFFLPVCPRLNCPRKSPQTTRNPVWDLSFQLDGKISKGSHVLCPPHPEKFRMSLPSKAVS